MPANPSKPPGAPGRTGRLVVRTMLGTALLVTLLAVGHALVWRWMGSQMQAGFDDWAAVRRAQGWRISYGPPLRGGWPLAATLALPQFRLEGGAATLPGGLDWQAESLLLQVALPRLDHLVVESPGRNRLRLGSLDIPFAVDRLSATLPLERNVLPREANVTAERLRLGTPAGTVEIRNADLSIDTRLTATEGEPAVELGIAATEIELPAGLVASMPALAALGRSIASLTLNLALTGPVPPGRGPAAKAESWRDGGGTLELRGLDLAWGPATGNATATLTLDEALQPMGAGSLRLTGAPAVVDAAAAGGLLTPRVAMAARGMARLLSKPPPEGGPPQLEVPLTLEDRTLTLARFPVGRLPLWGWPAPPTLPDAAQDPSLPARD